MNRPTGSRGVTPANEYDGLPSFNSELLVDDGEFLGNSQGASVQLQIRTSKASEKVLQLDTIRRRATLDFFHVVRAKDTNTMYGCFDKHKFRKAP